MDELYDFTLKEIREETSDVKTFVFEYAGDGEFTWQTGQYLDWQVPHDNADDRAERRWFSIASAPSEKVVLLSSRFTQDGKGSTLKNRLLQLRPGDKLQAKGPFGEFLLPEIIQPTVLVAGGIGITPFRSVLHDLAAKGSLKDVQLLYGNRSEENVPFKAELDQLAASNPGFEVKYVYSPVQINADVIAENCGPLDGKFYMISGLEKMVVAIHESLHQAGVSDAHIKIDDFGGYDYELIKPVY